MRFRPNKPYKFESADFKFSIITWIEQSMNSRVALVTGGSRRIGAAIVRGLHSRGLDIAIHYRESKQDAVLLSEALNQVRPRSAEIFGSANLLDFDACSQLIANAISHFSRLDVLVNSASIFEPTHLGETSLEEIQRISAVNVYAPFGLTQSAAPMLKSVNGAIVNVSDIYARFPMINYSIYCAAKASLESLTRSFALELAPDIRVNAIALGAILWPENPSANRKEIIAKTPLKRLGGIDEVASAVKFLACDATYMTGQVLTLDGGRTVSAS